MSRWKDFTDEELRELRAGALERHDNPALPTPFRADSGRLASELRKELNERKTRPTVGSWVKVYARVIDVEGTWRGTTVETKAGVIFLVAPGEFEIFDTAKEQS